MWLWLFVALQFFSSPLEAPHRHVSICRVRVERIDDMRTDVQREKPYLSQPTLKRTHAHTHTRNPLKARATTNCFTSIIHSTSPQPSQCRRRSRFGTQQYGEMVHKGKAWNPVTVASSPAICAGVCELHHAPALSRNA